MAIGDPLCWLSDTLCPQKLTLTSPTSGGRSVGIVRSRTKATELFLLLMTFSRAASAHGHLETAIDLLQTARCSQVAHFVTVDRIYLLYHGYVHRVLMILTHRLIQYIKFMKSWMPPSWTDILHTSPCSQEPTTVNCYVPDDSVHTVFL
jgi:hypothetical protein